MFGTLCLLLGTYGFMCAYTTVCKLYWFSCSSPVLELRQYVIFLFFFRCRAINSRSQDFAYDNCCLANTTALELHAHLKDDDVIYVSYENRVCKADCLC